MLVAFAVALHHTFREGCRILWPHRRNAGQSDPRIAVDERPNREGVSEAVADSCWY